MPRGGIYNPGTQVCTANNSWSTDVSGWDANKQQFMTNCINGTDAMQSKLYILDDAGFKKLNPDNSGGTDIVGPNNPPSGTDYLYESAIPSSGSQGALVLVPQGKLLNNVTRCGPTPYPYPHKLLNIGILEEIAQGVINLPIDDADKRLYVMQEQLYRLAKEDPTLVVNSGSIQQFIYDNQWSSLDFIYFIGKYLAEGKRDVADILLGMWTGNSEMDVNYWTYYKWMITMAENRDWMPDKDAVLAVANLCPVKNGTIVYAYRNLFNAITQRINKFDNSCGGELGRGVKKQQGFIRLKPKPVIAESNNNSILFPNPDNNVVMFKQKNLKTISVVDMIGNVVLNKQLFSNNDATINVKGLTNGVYVIKSTTTDGKIASNKLIVQH